MDLPELGDRGPWVVGAIVSPDHRGRGVGTALMSRLMLRVAEAGVEELWVATGGRAVDFYRGCGFVVTEVVRLPNGDDPTILNARMVDLPGTAVAG